MTMTKIEWADRTWNPVTGCTPISEGCENCYASRMAKRLVGRCGYSADEPFRVTLHPDRLEQPLRWEKPQRIFVCSMGDLFHPDIPIEFVAEVFDVMASWKLKCRKKECEHDELCWHDPGHTYMILTKRPQRIAETFEKMIEHVGRHWPGDMALNVSLEVDDWPLPNVWLGVTAENQQRADERIPILLQIPAAVRFVSVEPMLGPVRLDRLSRHSTQDDWIYFDNALTGFKAHKAGGWFENKLDWIICGGETGPGARPMHPDWAMSLQDQCQVAGVPFFFKQWGEWVSPSQMPGETYREIEDFGNGIGITNNPRRVGKKRAGRLLDGREWSEFPGVSRP